MPWALGPGAWALRPGPKGRPNALHNLKPHCSQVFKSRGLQPQSPTGTMASSSIVAKCSAGKLRAMASLFAPPLIPPLLGGPSPKATTIAVMLSPPSPPVFLRSGDTQLSSSSSMIPCKAWLLAIGSWGRRSRTKSMTSWLPITSQMPSHAITKNSSLAWRGKTCTSGVEQIICSFGGRLRFFLYSRSPIERERFRLPFTRNCTTEPNCCRSIEPPALLIRFFSLGQLGL
mmetsp:Transcript_90125/g.165420  ORF Transcript_90125/g.165420 Transcript_90125/m.165420 type:complete len:230 (-) Transcript_90125:663-1352(-)